MERREMLKLASAAAAGAGALFAQGFQSKAAEPEAASDIKTGCACNLTDKTLVVHITSGHGAVHAYVKAGACFYFNFYDDKKKRVLSAFSKPNDLVAHFAFEPLANACLLIEAGTDEPKTRKERVEPQDAVSTIPV